MRNPFKRRNKVIVYRAKDGWRWRRVSGWNRELVAESGESYTRKFDCKKAALRENPGLTVEVQP